MEELPPEVLANLDALDKTVDKIKAQVESLLHCSMEELSEQMSGIEYAKLNTLLAYTLTTLYYVHLKAKGVSPTEHPLKEELDRVKLYFQKIRDLDKSASAQKPNLKLNVEAANRFLSSALQMPELTEGSNDNQQTNDSNEQPAPKPTKEEEMPKKRKSPSAQDEEEEEEGNKKRQQRQSSTPKTGRHQQQHQNTRGGNQRRQETPNKGNKKGSTSKSPKKKQRHK